MVTILLLSFPVFFALAKEDYSAPRFATVGGGIWKTSDAGESWKPLTEDLPILSTTCIVMAASNHNILYLGTGESLKKARNFYFNMPLHNRP